MLPASFRGTTDEGTTMTIFRLLASAAACLLGAGSLPSMAEQTAGTPIGSGPLVIEKQGGFEAGGTTLSGNGTLSCDHGYVEYQIPVRPRPVAMFLWHSSSVKVFQNRWDGGEGLQSILLREGYPTYLWDGPRVGRANWGCEGYDYRPTTGRDEGNFVAWRLGPRFGEWFDGVQFPADDPEAWNQATRARYQEFDNSDNVRLQAAAAAAAIDRVGPAVIVTNSAGGFRALMTALQTDNVKAIVAYENPGFVLPEGVELVAGPARFLPIYVAEEDFRKLTRFPIQMVFGDNVAASPDWSTYLANSRQFARLINERGGKAEVLELPSRGLHGNTHIPFADLNNRDVAEILLQFVREQSLDRK